MVHHRQESDGIVVQVEKVSVERVLNEPGSLEYQDPHWRKIDFSHPGGSWRSFRFLRVFISFQGAIDKIASTQRRKLEFAVQPTGRARGVAEFEPPMWQRRLLRTHVDPKALGVEYWVHLGKGDDPWKLFPLVISLEVKLKNGDTLDFTFDNVKL